MPTGSPATLARSARPAATDPVDAALATSIGLDEEAIARLMSDVGFTRAGRCLALARPPRPPAGAPRTAPRHAFAELAKLRKK